MLLQNIMSLYLAAASPGQVLQDDSFKARIAMFNSSAPKEPAADPFQIEDPFRSDLLKGF